jgi:hypothetical protein
MPKREHLRADEYLLEISRQIYREYELPEKALAQTAVTLRRRFRGDSPSDRLGRFFWQTGEWLGDRPDDAPHLTDMHSFQIVKPIIKANQSSMVQARVQITVEPNGKDPNLAGVAAIAMGIAKFDANHPEYWSLNLENQINQQCQTDPGYFVRTYFDPDAESPVNIKVEEWSDELMPEPGRYVCAHCGSDGPLFKEQMGHHADDGTIPCLQCGELAEIETEPSESFSKVPAGVAEYPAGNVVRDVVSSFQVRVDRKRTKNGKVHKARWLEHHFLMDEFELQEQVPYFDLGAAQEWSYPIKWEQSLETDTNLFLGSTSAQSAASLWPQHEVRRIYVRPAYYRHYVSPSDFDLDRGDGRVATNREGRPMLSIKANQRLTELYPRGFWFVVCNGRLLPWIEECDLRDEWAYGTFLNDSASFWGLPATELDELQRTANNLYTIDVQHRESGSIVTTVFDREWFDPEDFEHQLSPTKEGVMIGTQDDINRHFAHVTPPNMTGAMEGIQFIRSIQGDVAGPQPATVGAPAKGEPYAAQRLQVQQSLGLLTPSQHSKAECKVAATLQHVKWRQRTAPIEWFQYVGTMYGEEWKQQDIEAFLNANLDLAIKVWYKEGSETPTSLIEQELKYRQFFIDVAQAAQYAKNPDILRDEIVSKYAEIAGIDVDYENVVADTRLANARYQRMKSWLMANVPSTPMTEAEELELVKLALGHRAFNVMPRENHKTHIEFYADHARALMAEVEPFFPLITGCLEMMKRHEEGSVTQTQVETDAEVRGQGPAIATQVAAQQVAAQQEQQAAEAERALRAQELQGKAAIQREALDSKERIAAAQMELDAAKHADDVALKAAEIEQPAGVEIPEAEPTPREQVAASAKFADLAPPAQAAILSEDLGLPTGGLTEVHQAIIAKQQIAATKQRAQQSRNNGASK